MPAILSALFSAVFAFMATKDAYGDSLYHIFPAMKNSTQLEMEGGEHEHIIGVRIKANTFTVLSHFNAIINFTFFNIHFLCTFFLQGFGRTSQNQALYQLIGIASTLTIAIVGGLLTGNLCDITFNFLIRLNLLIL